MRAIGRGLVRGLLGGVAAAAAALAAGCGENPAEEARRPLTVLQDDAVLLHEDDAGVRRALDDLAALGVDWVRVTAGWSVIAPAPREPEPPEFDAADPAAYPAGAWERLDRVVRLARERGLAVAIDIAFFAPRWAVARPSDPPDRQRRGIDPEAFADFAEAVARRYPGAAAFTIWNEPNFRTFWLPQWRRGDGRLVPDSPHAYREMLQASVPRVRAAAPDALVLIGATAPTGPAEPDSTADAVPPLRFVRELACVGADLRPLARAECDGFRPLPGDGFSHHPYSFGRPPWQASEEPDDVRAADLGRLVALLERLHEAGRTEERLPVYVTEYGYETDPPDPTARISPALQAEYLAAAERLATGTAGVRSVAQFLLRDLGAREGDTPRERWGDFQTGLRLPDGRPKPSQAAFRHVLDARRAGGGVSFWIHVRPARRPVTVRIARRGAGGWTPIATMDTDANGHAERTLDTDPEATYRLEVRTGHAWTTAPPVRVRR